MLVWPPANLTGYAISVRKVRALGLVRYFMSGRATVSETQMCETRLWVVNVVIQGEHSATLEEATLNFINET